MFNAEPQYANKYQSVFATEITLRYEKFKVHQNLTTARNTILRWSRHERGGVSYYTAYQYLDDNQKETAKLRLEKQYWRVFQWVDGVWLYRLDQSIEPGITHPIIEDTYPITKWEWGKGYVDTGEKGHRLKLGERILTPTIDEILATNAK